MTDAEIKEFCDRAVLDAEQYGEGAAVLLVGSRGAGFDDSWSDLDPWVLGRKDALSGEAAAQYASTGQVFVDRGDFEAHYSLYDFGDLAQRLSGWPDELLWLAQRSRILHDPLGLAENLKARFAEYPRPILEEKLRRWHCKYSESSGRLGVVGRGMPVAAVLTGAACIESACKICCLAEGKSFPYAKWLRHAAAETRLGRVVCPVIDTVVDSMHELAAPPPGVDYKALTPVKELKALRPTLCEELGKMGWTDDWAEDPGQHVWVLFSR